MGQYLYTGICYGIIYDKENLEKANVSNEDFIEALSREIDLSLYIHTENEDYYYFSLKNELIENELIDFSEKQLNMYGEQEHYYREIVDDLRKLKSANEIIEKVKENYGANLRYDSDPFNYLYIGDFQKSIRYTKNMIGLFGEGKIIMEEYNQIFRYFEKNIIKNNTEYQIAKATSVYIMG
ncbi:MAG: hypothetical protein N4A49_15645 [Marinifilaceae bacterium]|jgi:hypothetical protein|nr:hypothetical protein [Marinifilaceae bacterium]